MTDLASSSPASYSTQFLSSLNALSSDRKLIELIARADYSTSGVRMDGPAYELSRLVASDPSFVLPGRDRQRTEAIAGLAQSAVDERMEIWNSSKRTVSPFILGAVIMLALAPVLFVVVFSLVS